LAHVNSAKVQLPAPGKAACCEACGEFGWYHGRFDPFRPDDSLGWKGFSHSGGKWRCGIFRTAQV